MCKVAYYLHIGVMSSVQYSDNCPLCYTINPVTVHKHKVKNDAKILDHFNLFYLNSSYTTSFV